MYYQLVKLQSLPLSGSSGLAGRMTSCVVYSLVQSSVPALNHYLFPCCSQIQRPDGAVYPCVRNVVNQLAQWVGVSGQQGCHYSSISGFWLLVKIVIYYHTNHSHDLFCWYPRPFSNLFCDWLILSVKLGSFIMRKQILGIVKLISL